MHDALLLLSRCLAASLFLQSGITKCFHRSAALDELASFGLPRSMLLLGPALACQLVGGTGLVLGLCTRINAAALLAFMIPTTFIAHNFLRYQGKEREHHVTGFFQNLTMSAGLVLIIVTGPGAWSLDASFGIGWLP